MTDNTVYHFLAIVMSIYLRDTYGIQPKATQTNTRAFKSSKEEMSAFMESGFRRQGRIKKSRLDAAECIRGLQTLHTGDKRSLPQDSRASPCFLLAEGKKTFSGGDITTNNIHKVPAQTLNLGQLEAAFKDIFEKERAIFLKKNRRSLRRKSLGHASSSNPDRGPTKQSWA
ncbi:hypothetical protein D9757_007854 [Collybiopsis confluens]|uniref:Uncharacterized protein n=1 Tax=Collybiopsis confluens TaxID=2823264 RepID=A0A8H5HDC5_9AGAR|nr:hypothetical protein D9757_007854 [Collybiopsis confluens]